MKTFLIALSIFTAFSTFGNASTCKIKLIEGNGEGDIAETVKIELVKRGYSLSNEYELGEVDFVLEKNKSGHGHEGFRERVHYFVELSKPLLSSHNTFILKEIFSVKVSRTNHDISNIFANFPRKHYEDALADKTIRKIKKTIDSCN